MAGRENPTLKQFKTETVKGPGQTVNEKRCVSYFVTAAFRRNVSVDVEGINR